MDSGEAPYMRCALTETSYLGAEQITHADVDKPILFDNPSALRALASRRRASNHDFQVAIGCHNVDRAHTSDASAGKLLQALAATAEGSNPRVCKLGQAGGGCGQAGTGGGVSHCWPTYDMRA